MEAQNGNIEALPCCGVKRRKDDINYRRATQIAGNQVYTEFARSRVTAAA
jgi:hypothetical protein